MLRRFTRPFLSITSAVSVLTFSAVGTSAFSQNTTKKPDTTTATVSTTPAPQGQPQQFPSGPVTIYGDVKLKNNAVATSATVHITQGDFESLTVGQYRLLHKVQADSSGKFEVRVPSSPVYHVVVTHPGCAPFITTLNNFGSFYLDENEIKTRLKANASLEPGVSVSGRVIDDKGQPLKNATVTPFLRRHREALSSKAAGLSTSTTQEGVFTIPGITTDDAKVLVEAPGFLPAVKPVQTSGTSVTLQLKPGGGSVSGVVVMEDSGENVSSATVVLSPKNNSTPEATTRITTTDDLGEFKISDLPAGEYTAVAFKDKLVPFSTGAQVGSQVSLGADETTDGLRLQIHRGYTVRGTVRERKTSIPLEGVSVKSFASTRGMVSALTNSFGRYELTGLTQVERARIYAIPVKPEYMLSISGSGMQDAFSVAIKPGATEYELDLEMNKLLPLSGRVINNTGRGISNAKVSNQSMADFPFGVKEVDTNTSGEFTILVIPNQEIKLKATAPGFADTLSKPINVADEPVSGTEIIMGMGNTVHGLVQGPDGLPFAGASVTASRSSDQFAYSTTSRDPVISQADGSFMLTRLEDATWSITATADGYAASMPQALPLEKEMTTTGLILKLRKGHSIVGKVVNTKGEPISNASVQTSAEVPNETTAHDQTDSEGKFKLEGLTGTEYKLHSYHQDYKNYEKEAVPVGSTEVEIVMEEQTRTTLVGKVVDFKTGDPITNFTVTDLSGNNLTAKKDPAIPGQFTIEGIRSDNFARLRITAPGYAPLTTPNEPLAPKNETRVEKTYKLATGGGITGRTVNKEGEPVAGVKVRLQGQTVGSEEGNGGVASTETDKEGKFTLKGAPAGNATIIFIPPAPYVEVSQDANVEAAGTADMGDIIIGQGSTIHGTVTRLPKNDPVAGERVTLRNAQKVLGDGNKSVETDASGEFEFPGLTNGFYQLTLPGHDLSWNVMINKDEDKEANLRIGAITLKGKVVRGDTAVPQARVRMSQGTFGIETQRTATADINGAFELTGLTPGRWRASISGGNTSAEEYVELPEKEVVEHTFNLPAGVAIGKVVDEQGEPVPAATVTAREDGKQLSTWNSALPYNYTGGNSARTDTGGNFRITNLKSGNYKLTVKKDGVGGGQGGPVEVPEQGESKPVEIVLRKLATGSLVSVALSMGTGGPIKDAWCILWDENGEKISHSGTRDVDGVMQINDLPAGNYRMQVSSFGFSVSERNITIIPGETQRIEDVLYDAGALRLSVQTEGNSPVPGAQCEVTPVDSTSIEQPRQGVTDATGLLVVRGLFPGSYSLRCTTTDGKSGTGTVAIQAHQPSDAVVRVK